MFLYKRCPCETFSSKFLMAAQNDNHRYSKRNLVRTESFDKNLNRGVNRRHIVSSTLTFRDRIPNDVRCTGSHRWLLLTCFMSLNFIVVYR